MEIERTSTPKTAILVLVTGALDYGVWQGIGPVAALAFAVWGLLFVYRDNEPIAGRLAKWNLRPAIVLVPLGIVVLGIGVIEFWLNHERKAAADRERRLAQQQIASDTAARTVAAMDPVQLHITRAVLARDGDQLLARVSYQVKAPNAVTVKVATCYIQAVGEVLSTTRWQKYEDSMWPDLRRGQCADLSNATWDASSGPLTYVTKPYPDGAGKILKFVSESPGYRRVYLLIAFEFTDALGTKTTNGCMFADRLGEMWKCRLNTATGLPKAPAGSK